MTLPVTQPPASLHPRMRDRHYQIAAVDDATSAYSNGGNKDLATTILFTDDPLTPLVRAVHFTELRTAVNAARVAVGIPTVTFTDSIVPGVVVKVIHLAELRTFLDEARSVIGSSPVSYTNPILAPGTTTIKAAHIVELRNAVK